MKKIFLFFGWVLFFNQINSQIQDLTSMSVGDHVSFNAIYDKDNNLFGYMSLYDLGKVDKKTKKFEYIFLDKNLNKVSNKEFEAENTVSSYKFYMDFKGRIIFYPKSNFEGVGLFSYGKFIYPSTKALDLKKNTIKQNENQCYENGVFEDCPENKSWREQKKDRKKEKKEKGYLYKSIVQDFKYGGYTVTEYNDYEDYVEKNAIIKFDDNKKEQWRYSYNTKAEKKKYEYVQYIDFDEKYYYGILTKVVKKEKSYELIVIDINTGAVVHQSPIIGTNKETINNIVHLQSQISRYIGNKKSFEDKIILVGRNHDKNYLDLGFTRMMIDKKTFGIKFSTFLYKNDLKKFIKKIDKNGGVGSGYILDLRDVFIMKDGSVGILTEKFKYGYSNIKTTDMVYIFTDNDFTLKEVKVFEKDKTKGWNQSDYLFSQYLNDNKDVVFFYKDYLKDDETKEKNWVLYINTLINGEFKQENVKISSKNDKYFIVPYVAKEGYILLREFNEKDKYNQIRLERLNY